MVESRGARPDDAESARELLEQRTAFGTHMSCLTCGVPLTLVSGEEPERHRSFHAALAILSAAVLGGAS